MLIMNYQKEKVRKQSCLKLHQKRIKFLGIKLAKEVQDLYFENYQKLMKEIENDTKKRKDILCSWIARINTVKMSITKSLQI